ncbi:MAG: PepSY domain-containing protein [Gemmatimonadota bacterium]|nr:PepSY domain-containing protein [Gemmatimonadota bacterium]
MIGRLLSSQNNQSAKPFKEWIRLIHRYLAFVLSLMFLVWFLSGFVMMYKDFPSLSPNESRTLRKPLSSSEVRLLPHIAQVQSGITSSLSSVRSGMVSDRPVYWFQDLQGQVQTVYADTVERLTMDTMLAKRIVNGDQNQVQSIQRIDRMVELDQWTPTAEYLPHMPMYRVYLNDRPRTVLYVSSATGEIVQKLNARDKLWAWLGPIPHWTYLRDLRVHGNLWRQVVIWSAALGVVMCQSGIIQGVINYKRTSGSSSFSPYQKRWFRWHHFMGFIFGGFVFTWIFSGLLSMNPLGYNPDRALSDSESTRWRGGALELRNFQVHPRRAADVLSEYGYGPVKELDMIQLQARPYYLAYFDGDNTLLLAGDTASEPMKSMPEEDLLTAVKRMNPSPIAEFRLLTDYDAYYYAKNRDKPLPVYRIKMEDAPGTWYYINPKTSIVADKYQSFHRSIRWVYHGLHSLDFPQIYFKRPLWDIIVILLMTGGTSVSITGVILYLRWMKRKGASAAFHKRLHYRGKE